MSELRAGDSFPDGVTFGWVAPTPEKADISSCGIPSTYDASRGAYRTETKVLPLSRSLLLQLYHDKLS